VKFVAQSKKIFGSFILKYNSKSGAVDSYDIAVKLDDRRAIEFDLNKKWSDYTDNLREFVSVFGNDLDIEGKLGFMFGNENFCRQLKGKFPKREYEGSGELEDFFTNSLAGLLQDIDIVIKVAMDRTDVFEINKGRHFDLEEIDHNSSPNSASYDSKMDVKNHQASMLLIKSDLELNPVDGKPISTLKKGDLLRCTIIENSDVANHVKDLLISRMTKEELGEFNVREQKFTVEFDETVNTDQGKLVKFKFGPGIIGYSFFGEDVKVKVLQQESPRDSLPRLKKAGLFENLFVEYFWVLGGVLIFVIIIILFILTK